MNKNLPQGPSQKLCLGKATTVVEILSQTPPVRVLKHGHRGGHAVNGLWGVLGKQLCQVHPYGLEW